MQYLERFLERVAIIQKKYTKLLLIIILVLTAVMILGLFKLKMQSDLSKNNPQNLEVYQLSERITEKFGGQDTILILIGINETSDGRTHITDIRDAQVIAYMTRLERSLKEESTIDSVTAVSNVFIAMPTINQETIDTVLDANPGLNNYFSDDYKYTFMIVRGTVGQSEEQIREITGLIEEKIAQNSKPAGTVIHITGNPPIRVTLLEILAHDAVYTLIIAFIIIFILLCVMEQSVIKAILISLPLLLGLIWTAGTMGHLGIEISIATAGLGAMILGLGVEYGVFMLKRYEEERAKGNDQLSSLKVAIPSVGTSVMASGLTTVVGFAALMLSFSPMLQKLGFSLALGIFYCLFFAIFVAPLIFITFEVLEDRVDEHIYRLLKKRHESNAHYSLEQKEGIQKKK